MPLSFAGVGELSEIKAIVGKDAIKTHLNNLGFVVGDKIRVVSHVGEGVIVEVKGIRIALDDKLAGKIYV